MCWRVNWFGTNGMWVQYIDGPIMQLWTCNMGLHLIMIPMYKAKKLNTLKFYYKYTHGTLPSYFYTYNIETQGAHHSHDTRQQHQLRTNLTRTKYADNTLRNHLPVLVNGTPLHILQKIRTHSIYGFSSSVKQYYLNMYRIDCSIPNCYVCHR